jgi:nitroreductase
MNIIEIIKKRQTASNFSQRPVDKDIIERLARSAEFSPVGTEKIPLKVIVVSRPEKKLEIRQAAEQVEKAYIQGASVFDNSGDNCDSGNNHNWKKPFLEEAPYLLVMCSLAGQPYNAASTWLALGKVMMVATELGLGCLCYTPSMPTFLRKVLNIAPRYMPIAIIPVGYSADQLFPTLKPEEEKMFRNLFSGRFKWQKS